MRLNPHLSWALPLALVGCSLSTIDPRPCADSADCRDAFGYGHACADDGFCTAHDLPDRCVLFPADTVYPIDPASELAKILARDIGVPAIISTSGPLDYDPLTEETSSAIDVWTISPDGSSIVVDYVSE